MCGGQGAVGLNDSHSNQNGAIALCGFDLHFPGDSDVQHLFIYLLATSMSPLKKCLFRFSAHFQFFSFFFWPHGAACGILGPGIEPMLFFSEAQSPNHWDHQGIPCPFQFFYFLNFFGCAACMLLHAGFL